MRRVLSKTYYHLFFVATLLVLVVASLLLRQHAEALPGRALSAARIEKLVQQEQHEMQDFLDALPVATFNSHQRLWEHIDSLKSHSYELLVFQGYEMVGWNSSLLPVDGFNPQYFKQALVRLENGWYLTRWRQEGDVLLVAFSLFKRTYLYQNQFLQNGFPEHFGLDPSLMISREPVSGSIDLHSREGSYLFSLVGTDTVQRPPMASWISDVLLLLGSLIFWLGLYRFQSLFYRRQMGNLSWLLAGTIFSLGYYLVFWKLGLACMERCDLFSPYHFAWSNFLPSLGHFFLFGFWLFTLAFWFFRFYRLPSFYTQKMAGFRKGAAMALLLALTLLLLVFVTRLFYILANHSSGPLVLMRVIDLDLIVLVRFFSIAFLLLTYLLVAERMVLLFLALFSRKWLFLTWLLLSLSAALWSGGLGVGNSDWTFVFSMVVGGLLIFARRKPEYGLTHSSFLWLALSFSLFAGMVMMDLTVKREEANRELLAENLSFQLLRDEDPVAEMYLSEIEKQLSNDVTLMRLLAQGEVDGDLIRNHLVKFYFYGYWGRFDLQIVPCWPQGDLYLEGAQEVRNCYDYFYEMLENFGYAIPGSNHFHYLDNQNGRVSYLGVFRFFANDPQRETSLFIELQSKPFFEGLGYPELLVSERERARMGLLDNYSYAKYLNGRLVKRSGEFPYKGEAQYYQPVPHSKVFVKDESFSHLVYQPDEEVTIVLSREDYSLGEVLIAFSLFFLFFFLLGALLLLLMQWRSVGFSFQLTIQNRIQLVFVLLLLLMLVVVATGTVYYTVNQFKRKHLELLENKVQSILLELEYKIGLDGPETARPEEYLNYQLQMISNVFYCDINLYGVEGTLLGTSRPELFRNGLMGAQMNPKAYYKLAYTDAVRHLEEEQIGSMSYTSFYVPLLDVENRLSGFVNLPYFVGNNELREEVSSVVVTVVNFYLIFTLVVISLAVFLARQITRPLLLLQSKISQVKLDRSNEKIDYKGEDEIGGLVAEYNRMVDELAISAAKLAKTERDMAWREMAKQIAHEIKNPLTPMKLSIQYLQRAWNDKVEDFDSYLTRVTGTLIEQINSLSSIASEFSKFAQMPLAKAEVVNLMDKLESCRTLFGDTGTAEIALHNEVGGPVMVRADGEQLLGVFNNLIKNALQSVPEDREGRINIVVALNGDMVRVAVADNGQGVPEEVREHLFVPSFTTKTGGMGLGLAISRRVVENAGGQIWFETRAGEGSVFYVELPQARSLSSGE